MHLTATWLEIVARVLLPFAVPRWAVHWTATVTTMPKETPVAFKFRILAAAVPPSVRDGVATLPVNAAAINVASLILAVIARGALVCAPPHALTLHLGQMMCDFWRLPRWTATRICLTARMKGRTGEDLTTPTRSCRRLDGLTFNKVCNVLKRWHEE